MKYTNLVGVRDGFQASVNLEYDLNNIDKIRGYIPTEQSVKILGELLRSYYYKNDSKNRATVLIGPYGRGKSHLLLILCALLSLDVSSGSKENAAEILSELCDKISSVDKEVGAMAQEIVDSGIRTLPVIINSNSTDINQAFLIAINDSLRNSGLQKLLPDTYFDSAAAVIDRWRESFPDALSGFSEQLKRHKTTVNELYIALKRFDHKAYTLFCDCYPLVAAGTKFNPMMNMDVVKLYLGVANKLCESTKYRGITVIFDEFSKFLEANLDKSRMLNFKIIQDMAEAASRSGDSQLNLTCVTHKDIIEYSSSDSFKTVEGRFRKLQFVASSEQSYELIANAILKKEGFAAFKEAHTDDFKHIASKCALTNIFEDLSENVYLNKLVFGCFPLTPLSAYALLHISELVGQNERTLFTFLSQDGQYTLNSFIQKDHKGFDEITIEYIYGYFEDQLRKEIFNTSTHTIWAKANSALIQVSDIDQRRIIQSIAIINMIGDERLKAVPAHIKTALMISDERFDNAIRGLLKRHIVSQRDSLEYVLLTANGIDVQKNVDSFVKTKLPRISECAVLERAAEPGYVLPHAHNDNFGMTRCFRNIYMDAQAFSQYTGAKLLSEYTYDGLIINIVCVTEELRDSVLRKIREFTDHPQIVLCITKLQFTYELLLKQYEAVTRLLSEKSLDADPHYIEELEVYGDDLRKQIRTAVHTMYSPSSEHSFFVNCDGELSITNQTGLNREISRICDECYYLTPVVNNEMVNKRRLNTQNTKARNLVIDWLLSHSDDLIIPCMDGFGPEVSIFKSAFGYTGLAKAPRTNDNGMNDVLDTITKFIESCESSKHDFDELYDTLTAPPYGMRKGIIPLYIAYELRQFTESAVVYYRDKEIELSAATLSDLNDAPENYQLLTESGTADRKRYLDTLEELFERYSDPKSHSVNRIYSIVRSMQGWIRSLPEYTKKYKTYLADGETVPVDEKIICVRSELLKFDVNSRGLLFGIFPEKLGGNYDECLSTIERVKSELDGHLANFRKELVKKLTGVFIPYYKGGLSSAVMSWYRKLPDTTKKHIFDADTNTLLSTASVISTYDNDKLLDTLVSIFISISIEDWSDQTAETFIRNISESVSRVNEYVGSGENGAQSGKLAISVGGISIEKTFANDTITPLGKTALNNLRAVFEEYNDALEPDERLAILTKLIGEIIS